MTPVLLDLDLAMGAPGSDIDDGFALALAVADPEIDLRLVTTVSDNTDAATATALTLELLDRLVAVGPLTNVAMAMLLEPAFAESLGDLVIMGGVFAGATGSADRPGEFNVWSDPAAARIVLQSGRMATWVGLDVTRRVRLSRREAEGMAADAHPFTAFAGRYSVAWIDHLKATADPATESCPLHDPLAVAAVSRPELLTFAEVNLDVQLDGVTRGVMVAGHRTSAARPVNARIAVDVDPAGFADHFTGCLRRI